MAVTASRPSVGTSATLIASNASGDPGEGDYRSRTFVLRNVTATAPVFLGGSAAVTTATGFQWDAANAPTLTVTLEPGESLYGIVTTTAQVIHALSIGR